MSVSKDISDPARLAALSTYDILGTAPEQDFDDIVQLASRLCDTPVSLVSLVAEEHQFFKAAVGVDMQNTPIGESICAHALAGSAVLEIPNTTLDPRTRDNPLVCGDAGVRFYAGAPLRTEEGHTLGTLCVLDFEPRALSDLQREALTVLARQVIKQFELRRTLAEAEVLRRDVDHRVRNSLQSLAALTRLQSRAVDDPLTRQHLRSVVQRIETVAALHNELYRANDQGMVNLAEFLHDVATNMQSMRPRNVSLDIDFAPFRIEARRAAAVATVINEFVQNSFAHGFPNDGNGSVRLEGVRTDADGYRLTLSDDGEGDGTDREGSMRESLGFTVIEACAAQIGGTFEREDGVGGMRAHLTFSSAYM